jgi:hypothetical protein
MFPPILTCCVLWGERYRKRFVVDDALRGGLVWLTFDGVYRSADVYLNGIFVGHHEEGYTTFQMYVRPCTKPCCCEVAELGKAAAVCVVCGVCVCVCVGRWPVGPCRAEALAGS